MFCDCGWHGINIDANPGSIKLFNKMRKRDINILSGVSDVVGEMNYYFWGENSSMNTFSEELYLKWSNELGMKVQEIMKVKVRTINDIIDENLPKDQVIDFVNLDVEGFDMKVLKSYNFEKYAPEYFLIEDLNYDAYGGVDFMNFAETELYKFMKGKGYIVIAKTVSTIIFEKIKVNQDES